MQIFHMSELITQKYEDNNQKYSFNHTSRMKINNTSAKQVSQIQTA
jgi:hypothetical protein